MCVARQPGQRTRITGMTGGWSLPSHTPGGYGDTVFQLAEGDAVYADGTIKHRLVNTGSRPAQVLIVFARLAGGEN